MVSEASELRDMNGLKYARNAVVMTGVSLNVDGVNSEDYLTDEMDGVNYEDYLTDES